MLNTRIKGPDTRNRRDTDALNLTVRQLKDDHGDIHRLIESIENLTPADREKLDALVQELSRQLFDHFRREEEVLFPAITALLGSRDDDRHNNRTDDPQLDALGGPDDITDELTKFMEDSRQVFMLLTEHSINSEHYDFASAHERITRTTAIIKKRIEYEEARILQPLFQT